MTGSLRVAVLGCGAIGGTVAVRTARRLAIQDKQAETTRTELVVVDRDPRIHDQWRAGGLSLQTGRRSLNERPLLVRSLEEAANSGLFDVILLTTKSTGLMALAEQALPCLKEEGFFVTVQNGLVALELSKRFGARRVVPGCVLWGASMTEPGIYELTAGGPFIIGALSSASNEPEAQRRMELATRVLALSFPVRRAADMQGVLWSKLAITASLTSLGAITGRSFGALVRRTAIRRLILAIGEEVGETAHARGIDLQPLGPLLDVGRFVSPRYPALLKHLLMLAVGIKHRKTRSAMLASLEAGEKTEIDFINGEVVRLAAERGLAAPVNDRIVEIVRHMERDRIRPSDALLNPLLEEPE